MTRVSPILLGTPTTPTVTRDPENVEGPFTITFRNVSETPQNGIASGCVSQSFIGAGKHPLRPNIGFGASPSSRVTHFSSEDLLSQDIRTDNLLTQNLLTHNLISHNILAKDSHSERVLEQSLLRNAIQTRERLAAIRDSSQDRYNKENLPRQSSLNRFNKENLPATNTLRRVKPAPISASSCSLLNQQNHLLTQQQKLILESQQKIKNRSNQEDYCVSSRFARNSSSDSSVEQTSSLLAECDSSDVVSLDDLDNISIGLPSATPIGLTHIGYNYPDESSYYSLVPNEVAHKKQYFHEPIDHTKVIGVDDIKRSTPQSLDDRNRRNLILSNQSQDSLPRGYSVNNQLNSSRSSSAERRTIECQTDIIIADLKAASGILPNRTPKHPTTQSATQTPATQTQHYSNISSESGASSLTQFSSSASTTPDLPATSRPTNTNPSHLPTNTQSNPSHLPANTQSNLVFSQNSNAAKMPAYQVFDLRSVLIIFLCFRCIHFI